MARMLATKRCVFRFVEVEVREREFSLTKAGERLAVEPKAFRVLLILLRNQGKLVPKQELLDAVWGDTAVTENSLARAVALLRKLLGDEARTPRFIETVATLGYRFVASVEAVEDIVAVAAPDPAKAGPAALEANTAPSTSPVSSETARRGFPRRFLITCGTAAALVLLASAIWYLSRPLPPLRISAYTQITHDGRNKGLVATDGNRLYFTQASPSRSRRSGSMGGRSLRFPSQSPDTRQGFHLNSL